MVFVKCRFCGKHINEHAVICVNCGTNLQTGEPLKQYRKTANRRRVKVFIMLFFMVGLLGATFYYFKDIKKNIPQLVHKTLTINSSPKEKEEAGNTEEKENISRETKNFPSEITESADAEQYKFFTVSRMQTVKSDKPGQQQYKKYVSLNIKVVPPANLKAPLRLKIYSGNSPNGKYELIYDQEAVAKEQKIKTYDPYENYLKLPDKYKNAPEHVKKRFLEYRKKSLSRRHITQRKSQPASFCAFFNCEKQVFPANPNQQYFYFRPLLYDANGNIIKEAKPIRLISSRPGRYQAPAPGSTVKFGYDSRPPSLNGHTVYPYFYGRQRVLKFAFLEKKAFKIIDFSIDGISYCPVFTGKTDSKHRFLDRKTRKSKEYYSSSMSLNYPFGGQVKLSFLYKCISGGTKKGDLSFYLPPPPPLIKAKVQVGTNNLEISWDSPGSGLDEEHFSKPPKLALRKGNFVFKTFPVYGQNSFCEKDVFDGEPVNYQILYEDGIYKAALWNSENGVKNYDLAFDGLQNPFQVNGVNITAPGPSGQSHPVRIELLSNYLCYENTGIASCKLLQTVIDAVNNEKDMVFYDRVSRNYILDEKYFALSDALQTQFLIKESDYAVEIKDYSRQDGNGLELWLFKKSVEGSAASKKTKYWRIADIKLNADKENMQDAANRLIAKIRDTLDFKACEDKRVKNISPANVICTSFRPVNQEFVVWNYEAICESLFLMLGEKSDTVKILSHADWNKIFYERISRFDDGHSIIDKMLREVLLTGRMWKQDGVKTYYIQACDAFSGELIDCGIFAGKTGNVAARLAEWLKNIKLSDNIKVDFAISKFHQSVARKKIGRQWRPERKLVENYGPYIQKPQVRKKFISRNRTAKRLSEKEKFYNFVKRQWQDGFRAKAIELLEKDWKKAASAETGELLSSYYIAVKRFSDAFALYKHLLLMDDCPVSVYANYNFVKQGRMPESDYKPVGNSNSGKQNNLLVDMGKTKVLDDIPEKDKIDYKATIQVEENGRRYTRKIINCRIIDDDNLGKYYFVDRDRIYADWAPEEPCRTAKLMLSVPGTLLSQGISSPKVKEYGVWFKAYLYGPLTSFDRLSFFRLWENLRKPPSVIKGSSILRISTPAEKRQINSVCKSFVAVMTAGWNSINPFSSKLNDTLAYTRLAYFFGIYRFRNSTLDSIYHYSKVRAFFELVKNPDIKMPEFAFPVYRGEPHRAYVSQLTLGKDMIRYWALEAENSYKSRNFKIWNLELYQLLALSYFVKHNHHKTLQELYYKLRRLPIPTTLEAYHKSQVRPDFLVFMAYRKNPRAVKMLSVLLNDIGHFSRDAAPDYAYVLALAGYPELSAKMSSHCGDENTVLRWAPSKVVDKILVHYLNPRSEIFNYLTLGTKNDQAARKWFLMENCETFINQYFGKPPAEAYWQWRQEHLEAVKKLNAKEVVK